MLDLGNQPMIMAVLATGAAAQNWIAPQPYGPAPVLTVGEQDSTRNFTVPVNGEIRARFLQPVGPYSWQMQQNPSIAMIAPPIVEQTRGDGYGAPQAVTFRVRPTRPGRFGLVFALRSTIPGEMRTQRQVLIFIDAVESAPGYRPDRPPYRPQPQPQPRPDWNDGPDTVEPLTDRDAGRVIDVPARQEQTIVLPSNASTGFHWEAVFPTNVSVIDDIREERPRGAGIGAGGTSIVRFRVNRPGPAEITMLYLPPDPVGNAVRRLTYRFRGI